PLGACGAAWAVGAAGALGALCATGALGVAEVVACAVLGAAACAVDGAPAAAPCDRPLLEPVLACEVLATEVGGRGTMPAGACEATVGWARDTPAPVKAPGSLV